MKTSGQESIKTANENGAMKDLHASSPDIKAFKKDILKHWAICMIASSAGTIGLLWFLLKK